MFEIFWDDEDVVLVFQFVEQQVYAHAEVFKWSKSRKEKFEAIWEVAKKELAEKGYAQIYVLIPDNDKKLYKFEQTFGFEELRRKAGCILMSCTTE